MRNKFLIVVLSFLFIATACKNNEQTEKPENLDPKAIKVEAVEVLQTKSYTYVKVDDYGDKYWIAITKRDVEEGGTYYFLPGMEMKNFESKELGRTFDSVFFIQDFSDKPILAKQTDINPHGAATMAGKIDVSIEPVEGGITIADLYSDLESYENKTVIIKGKVTKYNEKIMGKNWIHIQDGTENNGKFDLTITTDDVVKIGDIVTFEGSIALNRDLGMGYTYEVIMEIAKLK